MAEHQLPPLPEPAFRLTWKGERAAYYVSKPGIDSTDCYTAEQMRAYVLSSPPVAVQEEGDAKDAALNAERFLPELPDVGYLGDDVSYGYDSTDMRDYALEAVRAAIAAMKGDQP